MTRMLKVRRCAALLLSAMPSVVIAGEARGTVAEIVIDKPYGNFAFVRLDTAPTSPVACSINGYWHFTVPLATEVDKKVFAMLMTARATGAAVQLVGTGACDEFGTIESLRRVGM
jgi:hypothetical protein